MTTYNPAPDPVPRPASRPRSRPRTCETENRAPDRAVRALARPPARTALAIDLDEQAEKVAAQAIARGLPAERAGIHPLPEPLVLTEVGTERWLLAHADQDPVALRRGALPVPWALRASLTSLRDDGVGFSALVVAHQLPGPHNETSAAADDLLSGVRRSVTAAEASALVPDPSPHPKSARTADRLGAVSGGIGRLLAGGAMAVGVVAVAPLAAIGSLALLDPVILAALSFEDGSPAPGDPMLWFSLGRWDW